MRKRKFENAICEELLQVQKKGFKIMKPNQKMFIT